jgi:hypothetical protein
LIHAFLWEYSYKRLKLVHPKTSALSHFVVLFPLDAQPAGCSLRDAQLKILASVIDQRTRVARAWSRAVPSFPRRPRYFICGSIPIEKDNAEWLARHKNDLTGHG